MNTFGISEHLNQDYKESVCGEVGERGIGGRAKELGPGEREEYVLLKHISTSPSEGDRQALKMCRESCGPHSLRSRLPFIPLFPLFIPLFITSISYLLSSS